MNERARGGAPRSVWIGPRATDRGAQERCQRGRRTDELRQTPGQSGPIAVGGCSAAGRGPHTACARTSSLYGASDGLFETLFAGAVVDLVHGFAGDGCTKQARYRVSLVPYGQGNGYNFKRLPKYLVGDF